MSMGRVVRDFDNECEGVPEGVLRERDNDGVGVGVADVVGAKVLVGVGDGVGECEAVFDNDAERVGVSLTCFTRLIDGVREGDFDDVAEGVGGGVRVEVIDCDGV